MKEGARKVVAHSSAGSGRSAEASGAGIQSTQPFDSNEKLRQQNAALAKENEELRRVAGYRSAFLVHLAHELRTPLTSILGFAEILISQEQLTETQRNFCERIQNSAQQLQTNLNQLAELSRLEAAPLEILSEEFSLEVQSRESANRLDSKS